MTPILYQCTNMRRPVQGWRADDVPENGRETYQSVLCLACRQLHWVNLKTGKTLGAGAE
jgi:hypothetical protein